MLMEPLTEAEIAELNFVPNPVGPSSRGCCKVSNGNSCGSGSLVGVRNGKSIVLTNAHVAGTRIGHTVVCEFPFANNKRVRGRVVMAGYSDRVMMDWAVLELEELLDLPHVKLANTAPTGAHYTAGYPRCRGPFFSQLTTRQITHNGTVWRWQPNAIGGQSGSGVHSLANNLQFGLLTWSWGGDGAGQTCRSIWFQYVNRAAVGFLRPDGLTELCERAENLEEGFFAEANITTLPIWAHLDDVTPPPVDPDQPGCTEFAKAVFEQAKSMQDAAGKLAELARSYGVKTEDSDDSAKLDDDKPSNGPLFGL
jgi:hypothetical protein